MAIYNAYHKAKKFETCHKTTFFSPEIVCYKVLIHYNLNLDSMFTPTRELESHYVLNFNTA
jgi:hypothetical protein